LVLVARVVVPVFGAGAGHFSAGQSVAAPRYVVMSPALTGRGDGVASGATKLVPATLSGLAQCRKQCPSLMGVCRRFFTIRHGRRPRLPLLPSPRRRRGTCRRDCIRLRIHYAHILPAPGQGLRRASFPPPMRANTCRLRGAPALSACEP